jgi:DNA-binding NarL/FixJ family response regulator
VLRQLLNREGYETVEACDGREGVNAPKQPMDVLILDMLLPEQNGLEVIRALRGVDQAVPIIAISGYGHTGPVDVLVTVTRQASGIYPQAGGTRPNVSSMQYALICYDLQLILAYMVLRRGGDKLRRRDTTYGGDRLDCR